jgi:PadR family transcriptional regulator PadR
MNPQFNKGIIEMCILALLCKRDFYGYELVDTLSKHIDVSESTVYPILRRLTQADFFETYLKESSGGPARKYYRMTKSGQLETKKLLKDWQNFINNVDSLLRGGSHD